MLLEKQKKETLRYISTGKSWEKNLAKRKKQYNICNIYRTE